ncbi:MAG: hypothetical protein Q8L88_15410 [Bacteroidota bacterium]|nr:hypothetical protein [Bacteroidota bacterium]
MKHYSEHILDLYVRNSNQIADKRIAIEQHLLQCSGCRTIAGDLREFYLLEEENKKLLTAHDEHDEALIVQPGYIRSWPLAKVQIPNSLPARVWHFAKRRPFASAISLFGLAALMIFSIKQFNTKSDTNPQYFDYYIEKKQIAVFNSQQQLLWTLPLKDIGKGDERDILLQRAKKEMLLDIDDDGKNELLTTRFLLTQSVNGVRILHIINSDGTLKRDIELSDKEIQFRSLKYNKQFEPTFLYFDSLSQSLFVAATNNRSPWLLIRYDRDIIIVGKYWHYGGIQFVSVDVDNDGKKEIATYGKNDVDDIMAKDFAFLTFLDPAKITGETEATTTRGFGLAPSNAELLSIKFPSTDVNKATGANSFVQQIVNETPQGFSISVCSIVSGSEIYLEYYFSKIERRITDVKWNTGYESLHKRLKDERKITSIFNEQYLRDLATKVEYWDVNEWRTKPKTINN